MREEAQHISRHLVDREMLNYLDQLPPLDLSLEILPALREQFGTNLGVEDDPAVIAMVDMARRTIPGKPDDPEILIALHTPRDPSKVRGAILHIHGGGYVVGDAFSLSPMYRKIALDLDCVITSVDYRLAPETPFPGAIEDCYAAMAWLFGEARALGVDPARIGVMGESAGGGLAAALALLARGRSEFRLSFQHLIYPLIDDRTGSEQNDNRFAGEFLWTVESNRFGWRSLLGKEPGGPDVSPYAAAARATDVSGLPPTFLSTGSLDLFVDETITYAHRLIRAGVPTELVVYPGAYHGFHFVPGSSAAMRAFHDSNESLRKALHATVPDARIAAA